MAKLYAVGLLSIAMSVACSGGDDEMMGTPNGGSAGSAGAAGAGGTAAGSAGAGGLGGDGGAAGTIGGAGGLGGVGGVGGAGGAGGTAGTTIAGTGGMAGAQGGSGGMEMTGDAGPVDMPFMCPETSTLTPGESNETATIGGATRDYILHVPDSYTGDTPMPLVIDWHPLFGSATGQRGGSGYRELADSEGFIVAWPDGIDNAWNVGPCCTTSREVDDVGFARAMVEAISSRGCVDPKRIYSTGFSMGGGMSHYLACQAADVFAAVVPAGFDLLELAEQDCEPARPISVLSFRSTNDIIVPYEGGPSNPPNGLPITIHFEGAEGTRERWKSANECTDTPSAMPGTTGCESYKACSAGTEVGLCTRAAGHTYGEAELGWDFMKRHPMP
jgi:polyhydroxybutyrate depolymerase